MVLYPQESLWHHCPVSTSLCGTIACIHKSLCGTPCPFAFTILTAIRNFMLQTVRFKFFLFYFKHIFEMHSIKLSVPWSQFNRKKSDLALLKNKFWFNLKSKTKINTNKKQKKKNLIFISCGKKTGSDKNMFSHKVKWSVPKTDSDV